jgi:hypothetical protein
MRWQTVLSGVLGLALLEAAVSSNKAAGRVGDLLDGIAGLVSHALSPTVPAIPDLRQKGGGGGAAAATSAPSDQSSSKTVPADWTTSVKSLYV